VKQAVRALSAVTLAILLASTPSEGAGANRRINAPYFAGAVQYSEAAIAWFGRVDASRNYTDVRIAYSADEVWINLSVFDQWLWEDDAATRSPASLEQWDAATVLLDTNSVVSTAPVVGSYRFVGELSWWRPRDDYQAAYVGTGTGWSLSQSTAFTSETGWRGDAPNNTVPDRGWTITFHIPFSSLGRSGPPPAGTVWHLGFIVHDKDSAAVPAVSDTFWPESQVRDQPATWGLLGFGLRSYPVITPPPSSQTFTIRHKLNGAVVTDAMVGGGSTCGTSDYFNTWGSLNYAGATTLVVQNESDVSDWPCFSKAYLDFPLSGIPPGKVLVSATLTVYQFGGSDPSQAQPSLIHVLTVNDPWTEGSIAWNTAPSAAENVSQSWVDPIPAAGLPWPGAARTWNVSWAVAQAYLAGQGALRLALYEADSAYHSGKYFTSADTGDWNEVGRPTLQIVLANADAAPPSPPTNLIVKP
jgi:hypothetical protein